MKPHALLVISFSIKNSGIAQIRIHAKGKGDKDAVNIKQCQPDLRREFSTKNLTPLVNVQSVTTMQPSTSAQVLVKSS